MRNLLKWMGVVSAHKEEGERRVFRRGGVAMRNQLRRMADLKQEVISVSAMRS
jgi:hypothetical protein